MVFDVLGPEAKLKKKERTCNSPVAILQNKFMF